MPMFKPLLIFLFVIELWSCRTKSKIKVESAEPVSTCCDAEPPPPPPPIPFQLIKTEQLKFNYGGSNINFQASLFTNRIFNLNGKELQTFSIYAKNDYEIDSFFFALPPEMNRFWQDLTILKNGTQFNIGYYNDEKIFRPLYEIHLGDFKLNKDRIIMKNIDTVK
jgi:hypothetical protein